MMKDKILDTLHRLREFALAKGLTVELFYHEEENYLMRFANSAVSLNTDTHLIHLAVKAYSGRKTATVNLITQLENLEEMQQAVLNAGEMVEHSQPLSYEPTIPVYGEDFADDSGCDDRLVHLSNEARLDYFNTVAGNLENARIRLSGIFSNGANTLAMINTRSEYTQYFRTSDAQITAVLAHNTDKWEAIAEQSAWRADELNPRALHQDLSHLLELYHTRPARQLEPGRYDLVFGPAAIAELLSILEWIGLSGELMKRDYSFLREEDVNQRVFSPLFTLWDDPTRRETYPFRRDFTGIPRETRPLIQEGVFQGFLWDQDSADEFGKQPTGHTITHSSLVMSGGNAAPSSLAQLIAEPRDRDLLYIPFLHYMNVVNPSQGIITASSRFGAMYLKKNGEVEIPFNVRITQSLKDLFGPDLAWISRETTAYNTSQSYDARNPTAVVTPRLMMVRNREISHTNSSF